MLIAHVRSCEMWVPRSLKLETFSTVSLFMCVGVILFPPEVDDEFFGFLVFSLLCSSLSASVPPLCLLRRHADVSQVVLETCVEIF